MGIEIKLPNVDIVRASERALDFYGDNVERSCTGVSEFIHKVIHPLALKHPEWKFEGSQISRRGVVKDNTVEFEVTGFDVFYNREQLGTIYTDQGYSANKVMYRMRNRRIDAEVSRGDSMRSGNAAKAIKIVEKYFAPVSPMEIFNELDTKACRMLFNAKNRAVGLVRHIDHEFAEYMREFIKPVQHVFIEYLTNKGVNVAELQEQDAAIAQFNVLQKITQVYDTNGLYKIVVHNSKYLVMHNEKFSVRESDELPLDIRGKLGMLKLVEVTNAIDDVGMRVGEDIFYVIGENNDVQS